MKHFVRFMIVSLMALAAAGCQDDLMMGESFGDGRAMVTATVDFKPMSSALTQTRAAGNALKGIGSLYVLLYDGNTRQLKKSWKIEEYTVSDEVRKDSAPEYKRPNAETTTKRAVFKLPEDIDFGEYYMYAVANIPDLLVNAEYSGAIQTVDGLKGIVLTWDNDNVSANGQMIGYFTKKDSRQDEDQPLVVNSSTLGLHAWLRRAASKVTVAFDATGLKDGIRIYLKSVKIKHIPKTCYLGRGNTPGYTSETFKDKNGKTPAEELLENGEVYYYNGKPGDPDNQDFESWPYVSRGKSVYGLMPDGHPLPESPEIADFHTEDTPALYFYENLQGDENTKPGIKDKRQDADEDGRLDAGGLPGDTTYILKDGVEFGTYIEVEGYYDARLSDRPGEGKIIYRFMLGRDVYKDYNAERNIHYKLTLRFNGYANDVDWHIEYKEDKEIIIPNPYYISYLYNQSASLPITLRGSGYENVKMEIRIIENHWWPTLEEGDGYEFADTTKVYPVGRVREAVWNGFLSLSYDGRKIIGDDKHYLNNKDWNEEEWNRVAGNGKRTFDDLTIGSHGSYSVVAAENGTRNLKMPFYTRPKQMIPTSGYTGNNVYVAYPREAKLEVKLVDKKSGQVLLDSKGKDLIDTISIIQVRRCVNPKGVWRSWDNTKSFHVVMKILPNEGADEFETYDSKGPWRAKVEIDQDHMIRLREAGNDGYVHGTIDTPMDFHIDFTGRCHDANTVRSAIVLVEYNNYTCHHRIFVRQGYAPLSLNDRKIKWHSFNLYSSTEETKSPVEEGSLFKYGNLDDAILAENNKKYGFQAPVGSESLDLAVGGSKAWGTIKGGEGDFPDGFSKHEISVTDVVNPGGSKVKVRVASQADYENLRNGENREFGYGVLYGDSATETLDKVSEVYGYYRDGDARFGMRGCFVYNKTNGKNLFFPIGASGYGRRRTDKSWYGSGVYLPGALQYAWRSKRYSDYNDGWGTLQYRPLFENVYIGPGAVYWVNKYDGSKSYLDINYFTLDFSLGANEPLNGTTSSACFIRCVEDVE